MYITRKVMYNEMGDGYDITYIMYEEEDKSIRIIHVGKYYEDMPSSVNTTHMNAGGYSDKS